MASLGWILAAVFGAVAMVIILVIAWVAIAVAHWLS